jgi:hypothetical protein
MLPWPASSSALGASISENDRRDDIPYLRRAWPLDAALDSTRPLGLSKRQPQ